MTDESRGEVEASAAADARDRGGHRWMAVAGGVAVLSFLALALLLFLWGTGLQRQVGDLVSSDRDNHAAAQTLAQQVRELGGTPKVEPPPGPTGAPGPQGAQGAKGDKGDPGQPGQPGQPGRDGQSPPCLNTPPQCQGVPGQPGATGVQGAQGVDGTNGQPGATGPAGPTGPSGPQGQPGTDGKPPASWTWTDAFGRTYQCTRTPGSPDSSPTYSCAAVRPTTSSSPPLVKPTR